MPTRKDDEKYDRAVEDSFPASDPPANSGIVGPQATRPARRRASHDRHDREPKGTPTNERHTTETAHQEEREKQPPK